MKIVEKYMKSKEVNPKRIMEVYADARILKFVVDKSNGYIRISEAYGDDIIMVKPNKNNSIPEEMYLCKAVKKHYDLRIVRLVTLED